MKLTLDEALALLLHFENERRLLNQDELRLVEVAKRKVTEAAAAVIERRHREGQ